MSDIVKWGLLVAGAVAALAAVLALPFVEFIDSSQLAAVVANIATIAGGAFRFGRGLINCFLTPFGRSLLTGVMVWLIGKRVVLVSIKVGTWVKHYIFK